MIKTLLISCLLLIFSNNSRAQDTIIMKNGSKILAKEIQIGDSEIKYKKFQQSTSNGIYDVLKSDVLSIKYQNGNIIDFSNYQQTKVLGGEIPKLNWRFSFGFMENYTKLKEPKILETWWRNKNNNDSLTFSYNPKSFTLYFAMASALGHSQRNWLGDEFFLSFTPKDAIHASNNYLGSNEVDLKFFNFSIIMFYGHSINYKKNLIAIFEPGIESGSMSGNIKLSDIDYKETAMTNISLHLAVGLDWQISKHLNANLRLGRRFLKAQEIHKSSTSSTGFSSFYVDKSKNDDLVEVDWSGNYISLGLAFSFFIKQNFDNVNDD